MSGSTFHPDLKLARFLPRGLAGPRTLPAIRGMSRLLVRRTPTDVEVHNLSGGASIRVHRVPLAPDPSPALLWMHGGGLVMGTAAQEDARCRALANALGITVASVDYRLAPEHPFPAALDDCYAALTWLAGRPDVDSACIAVGGESAGGGLAAALCLLARQRGAVRPVLQLLVYPMLDDRTTLRTDVDPRRLRLWSQHSNTFGWRSYLGRHPGDPHISPLAAPAREQDLSGLPPAWIGVGTHDLFHDEDVDYARRLQQAGVPCVLEVVPGAYHGFFSVEPRAAVSRAFRQAQLDALRAALLPSAGTGVSRLVT